MLEKFLKGTYSFERQLGKNIVFSKDEIAIIHKRKAFWEKLVHIENLINLPYFSQINQSELNMLLGEKGFEAKENDDLKEWEAMDQAIRNKKYGSVDLPKFKWINPTTQKAEDDTPFINFFIPFIKYAKGRLDEQINKCGTRYLVNDNLQKDMVKILIGHLYKLCIRVLILELNVCREENQLQGENATERMEFYSNVILKDEQYWEGLLVEYPVMYRLISKGVNNWINNMCDLLTRFSADQNYLCSIFRDNSRSFSIIKLDGDMSDAHNGGKTVFKLTLSNNKTIVYKPRSLKLDRYFNEVLEWYNSQCVKYPIYQPKIIDRETYGWMEFIENKKCQKESELEEYYYKIGVMLGLLYLLRTTDIHYENIIAFSANPVLIDLEALFHNRFHILEQNTAPGKITGIIEGSVRNVGILPNLTWHSKNHGGVDISALGGDSNQIVPMEMPVIKDYLSDEIRIEYDKGRLHSSNNRPISDDKKINIYNYRLSIEGGFLEAYSTIKESMNTFKQLVEIFKTVKVRQIIRSTQQYSTLLNIGMEIYYAEKEENINKKGIEKEIQRIQLTNVSFKYFKSGENILKRINISIKRGEKIAIVGKTGCGKSTLIKLILGLYKPTEGQLMIDGNKITELDVNDYRKHIGITMQEAYFFDDTIEKNIDISKKCEKMQIQKAAQMARLDQDISCMEKGYETRIGENGKNLSGGQRQRLSIARALVKNPDIIIFDEGTGQLDAITEKEIYKELKNNNITQIIVTHRLSTIKDADYIYLIEQGEIVEQGMHKDLIETEGMYAKMWKEQN